MPGIGSLIRQIVVNISEMLSKQQDFAHVLNTHNTQRQKNHVNILVPVLKKTVISPARICPSLSFIIFFFNNSLVP